MPKTRSGKILRGTMKTVADGDEWKIPVTIDDPAIFEEIGAALKGKGVRRRRSIAGIRHPGHTHKVD